MTVCLAALCQRGKQVVIASDRMLTGGDVEFEQDTRKIELVTDRSVALSAGSAFDQVDLIRNVAVGLHDTKHPSVGEIVQTFCQEFARARRQKAEELFLRPLGMTFQDFLNTQHQLAEPLLLRLIRNIEDRELELELIVTGVDTSGGHIYRVTDPGTSDCFDAVGFCAIGSGEHHAELAFIRSSYSPNVSLNQALFLAYQAKRDAEMAPGVGGQFTDLGVIDDEGFHFVHDDVLTQLKTAYEELRLYHNSGHSKVEATIDSMQLRWVDENQ